MNPTVVLVHGAWHSGEGFKFLQEELSKLHIDSVTIDLTSVANTNEPIGDMYQDAELVRSKVAKLGDCFVLGHSYGGLPITEGLSGLTNVKGLIYLTAFMLDKGETLYAACGSQDPEWWVRNSDNSRLNTNNPESVFYNTCKPEVAKSAALKLREQSLEAFNQPITKVAWQEINSTYIICEKDMAIPLFAQEAMSKRAKNIYRLSTDHSPFLSAPAELAELISKIIK